MENIAAVSDLMHGWAAGFAWRCRQSPSKKSHADSTRLEKLHIGKGGLLDDECSAFLRAFLSGLVVVEPDGCFFMPGERSGKHSLHLIGRNVDHVALHMEYLIHIGAFAELVLDHGWRRGNLEFERGEYDIVGLNDDGREVLLVEAKARVDGADSLTSLRHSFKMATADPGYEITKKNHFRKWAHLRQSVLAGPVDVLLVASGARWWFRATWNGTAIDLQER